MQDFKIFTLLTAITLSSCKTCDIETKIANAFAKHVAVQLKCSKFDKLLVDVSGMCSQHDFCSKDRIIPAEAVPSGSWSEAALSCLHVTGNIENLVLSKRNDWGCKKSLLDPTDLEAVCEKL